MVEGNQVINVCLNVIISTNSPGLFLQVVITSTDGTVQLGKYLKKHRDSTMLS